MRYIASRHEYRYSRAAEHPVHLNDASNYVFPDVTKSEIADTMTCTRKLRHTISTMFFARLCVIRLKQKGSEEKFSFTRKRLGVYVYLPA